LDLPQAGEEAGLIGAKPAPAPDTNIDLQRELFSVDDSAGHAASEPVDDDLFSEEPPKIEWRAEDSDDNPEAASRSMSAGDQVLFPYDEPTVAAGRGLWIRKRTSRTRRFFG